MNVTKEENRSAIYGACSGFAIGTAIHCFVTRDPIFGVMMLIVALFNEAFRRLK